MYLCTIIINKQTIIMNNIETFNTSTEAINWLENSFYGDSVMIRGNLLMVTKWNYDHVILTDMGNSSYRYNFKSK